MAKAPNEDARRRKGVKMQIRSNSQSLQALLCAQDCSRIFTLPGAATEGYHSKPERKEKVNL